MIHKLKLITEFLTNNIEMIIILPNCSYLRAIKKLFLSIMLNIKKEISN